MSAITRMEAQEWVNRLQVTRRARHKGRAVTDDGDVPVIGAETVCAAAHLMSQLFGMAMKETPPIVTANPFSGLELPVIRPNEICYFEYEEAEALIAAIRELSGEMNAVMTRLGMWVGLRPGELYGLHGHRVNWLRGTISVVDVMTRSGLRQWPKSKKSHRTVPVLPDIMTGMSACMTGRPMNSLVFTAPEGGPVDDGNFRDRVWYPAIERAGVRRFPPKVMRHTAASWLVMDGVPLYDVQHLLGHESFRTTSVTPTWLPTRTTGYSSRGLRGLLAHVWRTGANPEPLKTAYVLVGRTGFEPVTSSVSGKRSPAELTALSASPRCYQSRPPSARRQHRANPETPPQDAARQPMILSSAAESYLPHAQGGFP